LGLSWDQAWGSGPSPCPLRWDAHDHPLRVILGSLRPRFGCALGVETEALHAEEGCAPGQAGDRSLQDIFASGPISFGSPRFGAGRLVSFFGRRVPEPEEQIHALGAVQLVLNGRNRARSPRPLVQLGLKRGQHLVLVPVRVPVHVGQAWAPGGAEVLLRGRALLEAEVGGADPPIHERRRLGVLRVLCRVRSERRLLERRAEFVLRRIRAHIQHSAGLRLSVEQVHRPRCQRWVGSHRRRFFRLASAFAVAARPEPGCAADGYCSVAGAVFLLRSRCLPYLFLSFVYRRV
jgi:hypothetical protein